MRILERKVRDLRHYQAESKVPHCASSMQYTLVYAKPGDARLTQTRTPLQLLAEYIHTCIHGKCTTNGKDVACPKLIGTWHRVTRKALVLIHGRCMLSKFGLHSTEDTCALMMHGKCMFSERE